MISSRNIILYIALLFISNSAFSQYYNTEIDAKIKVENNQEFIKITGTAQNNTEINQSLRYVLSVIRTSDGNISKNDQDGRFILATGEKKDLSTTTINADIKDKVIILLLVYDNEDHLRGKDRIAFNEEAVLDEIESDSKEKPLPINAAENRSRPNDNDGVILKGIVIEETKTKPGRDFYRYFYSKYSSNNINGEKIVTIQEVLALGTNTKIEVKVGDEVILEFFLRPKQDYLNAIADVAIQRVNIKLQQLKKQKEIIQQF